MKINGTDVTPHGLRVLALPRTDDSGREYVVTFLARPANMAAFDELYPAPKAPPAVTRGGYVPEDRTDPRYIQAMKSRAKTKWAFMVVDSLEPSGIAWDTVKADDSSTWRNFEAELRALFIPTELEKILQLVGRANCLDEAYLERAAEFFFRTRGARPLRELPQNIDGGNSEFGERAENSASDPPA